MDSDSDFTIRGRLMSLVEKVAYLKRKMATRPKEKKDRRPSKSSDTDSRRREFFFCPSELRIAFVLHYHCE